jgi:electron transport complex protein RnfE
MGGIREVLGNGTFLGFPLFGPRYEPWVVMILPPGGFLTLGVILLGIASWHERAARRRTAQRLLHTAPVPAAIPQPARKPMGAV